MKIYGIKSVLRSLQYSKQILMNWLVVDDEGMNKNNTNENVFGDIEDDKVSFVNNYNVLILMSELEERNENAGCSRNKFDDDVFDVNDYNKPKEVSEEDEIIIMGNVNYYDAYSFDGKEVTPDRPRARNPSKYLCPPYIELHTIPKQKRRSKKKVDIKSTSPVPPPSFVVVHNFSVLRLQPYVAGGEVVIQNYVFHSYDVQHRLCNLVLDRDFWSALFRHTHDGWLEAAYHNYVQHITIWYRLLMGRRFISDRRTIMPPIFFLSCSRGRVRLRVFRSYCQFIHPLITGYLGNYDWRQWKSMFMTVSVEGLMKNSTLMEHLPNLKLGWQII
uniref:Uncharacterized protein n=1 Tax=Lactuca sativa TaxID=4236 RepID=A0A9R1WFB8_LACSA|nr:hypothetical protein LSAT_V11C200063900 [Lactuca sativa]